MQTIRLQVNKEAYKHLMWFLNKFKKEELLIINEDEQYISVQNYLQDELKQIETGNAEFIDIDKLDAALEATLRQHED
jgi:murein L,D-transpeptidase YafK